MNNENPNIIYPNASGIQVSEASLSKYLSRVMGWMFLGVLITAVMSVATLAIEPLFNLIFMTRYGVVAMIGIQLFLVLTLSAGIGKLQPSVATALFLLYSAITGITFCTIYIMFETMSILYTFVATSIIFLAMAIVGLVTKKDMTRIGSLAIFGLFGIIIAGIVNVFLGSSMLDILITTIGIVVFIALIAYDAQKTKNYYLSAVEQGHDPDGAVVHKLAIIGALGLYLDFINLFLKILRLFGKRR